MKANELRIGNYVTLNNDIKIANGNLIKEQQQSEMIIGEIYLEPIPLTEEWLFKFGFKKSNVYCFGNHKLIIESLMGDRHSCRYRVNPDESIWISELHYVHQLQNLYFALTGEELTFKSE